MLVGANWPSYLGGARHSSFNRTERVITVAGAKRLVLKWHFVGDPPTFKNQPPPGYQSSPTVYGGAVYIGSATGWFYKLSARTGAVLAKRFIGFVPGRSCGAMGAGFVDTATVAIDRATHQPMVYVGGANEVLYAMYASNLKVKWRSVIAVPSKVVSDYYQWSSPTIADGRIYIGISSHCDKPLVPGGLVSFDQATGARIARFYSLPRPKVGGSVWSSAAVGSSGISIFRRETRNPSKAIRRVLMRSSSSRRRRCGRWLRSRSRNRRLSRTGTSGRRRRSSDGMWALAIRTASITR